MAEKELHWLAIGYVSEKAKTSIEEQGGQIRTLSTEPSVVLVGLAHDPAGYWSWSHGQLQQRSSVEFWNTGEIQMEHLVLQIGPRNWEYCGVNEAYILAYDEDYDQTTRREKPEQGEITQEQQATVAYQSGQSNNFDPFLDELP